MWRFLSACVALLALCCGSTVVATHHGHVAYSTLRLSNNNPLPTHGELHLSPFSSADPFSTPSPLPPHAHSSLEKPSTSSLLPHPAGHRRRQSPDPSRPPSPSFCDLNLSPLYTALMGNYSMDLPGSDLPGMPLPLPLNSTSVDCALLCLTISGCASWSFAPLSTFCNQTTAECRLKSKVPSAVQEECRVSGVKVAIPGGTVNASVLFEGTKEVDRRNGDLVSFPLNGTSRDCAMECVKHRGCYHWVWEEPGDCTGNDSGFCWLKSNSTDAAAPASCRTTGDSLLTLGYTPKPSTPPRPPTPATLDQRLAQMSTHSLFIGIDRLGSPFPLDTNTACALRCLRDQSCVGWWFDHSSDSPVCHLMATVYMMPFSPYTHAECGYPPAHRGDPILNGNAGSDRPGSDLPGMPIHMNSTATPNDCAWLCLNTSGCVAWSYTPSSVNRSLPLSVCPSLASPSTSVAGGCYLKAAIGGLALDECKVSGVAWANLTESAYPLLSSTRIKPRGWLKQQMELQTTGQAGSLPDFYCDVQDSQWLGGQCDGGFGERFPYWINGQLAAYYLLNHTAGIQYAERSLDYIIAHARSDGWIKPFDNDPWGPSDILFALSLYYEHTSQKKILDAMIGHYRALYTYMFRPVNWQADYGWFYTRAADYVLNIQWLLGSNGRARGQQQFLMDVMEVVMQNSADWKNYVRCAFPTAPQYTFDYLDHGVNEGQGLKSAAVYSRMSHSYDDAMFSYEHLAALDEYHGQATGIFSGDEFLAGKSPTRGIEVCAVAETMFSLSTMFSVLGNVTLADRLELIAFNAFPATFTKDMTKHNYIQQPNMMVSDWLPSMLTANVNEEGQTYGLDPDDGCCTANHPQGWPKLALAAFMQSTTANTVGLGIAAVLLVPAEIDIHLPDYQYKVNHITIICDTDYPFQVTPNITWRVTAQHGFPFWVRVPGWAVNASFSLNGDYIQGYPGEMNFVYLEAGNSTVVLTMEAKFRAARREHNAVALYRGPLLFTLPISFTPHLYRPEPNHTDYFAFRPQSQWNKGLILNETTDDLDSLLAITQHPINPLMPFDTNRPGLTVTAKARTVKWGVYRQVPEAVPTSPLEEGMVFGETETVTLVPYGQTLLRMTELPTLSSEAVPSVPPTQRCVKAPLTPGAGVMASYTFDCSPLTNSTSNVNWTATMAGRSGVAVFDGYQHWIDLMQPNNGVVGTPPLPNITGGVFSVAVVFYSSRSTHGYCLLDISQAVHLNNLQLCVAAGGKAVIFSVYDGTKEYKVTAARAVTDDAWHNVTAEVRDGGEMVVLLDDVMVGQAKGIVPALLSRSTASVGRQSAPGNDGYDLFQGFIDSIILSSFEKVTPPQTMQSPSVTVE